MIDPNTKNWPYYQALFFLTDEDLAELAQAGQKIYDQKDELYSRFYSWLENHPFFQQYYTEDVLQAIRDSEDIFWDDLLAGQADDEYIERQRFFGQVFASVGIPFDAYLAFQNYYHQEVQDLFEREGLLTLSLLKTYRKLTGIAISTLTDGYSKAQEELLQEKEETLSAMSTPITPLWEGILLLPLVGFLDSERARQVLNAMLEAIAEKNAKVFILDIRGIAVMDSEVANALIKMSKAAKLMGCQAMLSGISGNVAQTIVDIGLDIQEIQTHGNMLNALRAALRLTNQSIF
ncbi:protoglobin domain-containing protein [Saprospira sp. CCB-QB6]|uniref:protoglobin domain-containing protein n=1 Tax=Saprospira sp. CCB-QB6 TaxID=3023936 RepID=UPI00234907BC|nr:protoglobin domain-containing protein [Saprospira sp. CCB-QB6]WCL82386.1 protoglobin domain-containing protein [Saprospira sp. CCB-QB6]